MISMNLFDCRKNSLRSQEIAAQTAEYERRHGDVQTTGPISRPAQTRVDLIIKADVAEKESKPAFEKRKRGRPEGSNSPKAPVAMIHDIARRMKESGIRQKQVADAMNVGGTYISIIMNGYHKASPAVAARILAEVIKLESAPPLPIVRGRGYPRWARREEMLEAVKFHGLIASDISRACESWRQATGEKQPVRAAEFLSGRKIPHPELARLMEEVIAQMVEMKK